MSAETNPALTDVTAVLAVTVRFFGAARAAAGMEADVVTLPPGATVGDAIRQLRCASEQLALVLRKCSFLCDGLAVRDLDSELRSHQVLDVLPPFAGG